ncbi:MAG: Nif11-like leader peptide family natural product precursor [Chlorobiaceae bacterium]
MSVENAKAFVEKMQSNETFCQRVMAISDIEDRISFIAKQGYIFEEDDIVQACSEMNVDPIDCAQGGSCIYCQMLPCFVIE